MTKIVYNACYGGFSLSRTAVLRAREISGDPNWGGACIKGDMFSNGEPYDADYGHADVSRHDPVLAQVVEELGPEASGPFAGLAIRELPAGTKYRIDEYDGYECVVTLDEHEWQTA